MSVIPNSLHRRVCIDQLNFSRVLITTDVWARGIDVQQVSLVINYDLPAYASRSNFCSGEMLIVVAGTVKTTFIVLVAPGVSGGRASRSTCVP